MISTDQLNSIIEDTANGICKRVVVSLEGEATSKLKAYQKYGEDVYPDYIYIRNDGWTLGACEKFQLVAYNMWRTDWIGRYNLKEKVFELYV